MSRSATRAKKRARDAKARKGNLAFLDHMRAAEMSATGTHKGLAALTVANIAGRAPLVVPERYEPVKATAGKMAPCGGNPLCGDHLISTMTLVKYAVRDSYAAKFNEVGDHEGFTRSTPEIKMLNQVVGRGEKSRNIQTPIRPEGTYYVCAEHAKPRPQHKPVTAKPTAPPVKATPVTAAPVKPERKKQPPKEFVQNGFRQIPAADVPADVKAQVKSLGMTPGAKFERIGVTLYAVRKQGFGPRYGVDINTEESK